MKAKDTNIAVLLSILLPGAGQIYCGRIRRGLAFLFGTPIAGVFTLPIACVGLIVLWLWSAFDAARCAEGPPKRRPRISDNKRIGSLHVGRATPSHSCNTKKLIEPSSYDDPAAVSRFLDSLR
jgi:hypothetical protein